MSGSFTTAFSTAAMLADPPPLTQGGSLWGIGRGGGEQQGMRDGKISKALYLGSEEAVASHTF